VQKKLPCQYLCKLEKMHQKISKSMSFQILKKTTAEALLDQAVGVKGRYRIEVVSPERGTSYFPFGEGFRDNAILDAGLNAMAAGFAGGVHETGNAFYDGARLTNYIGKQAVAMYGSSDNPTVGGMTDLVAKLAETGTSQSGDSLAEPVRGGDTLAESFFVSDESQISGSGSITFTSTYDFYPVMAPTTVREAGFRTKGRTMSTDNVVFADPSDISQAKGVMFSRFVLPTAVTLNTTQFLRITYAFTINIPALITPQPITLSSGDFDASGSLRLVGTYASLFGTIDFSTGEANTPTSPAGTIMYNSSPDLYFNNDRIGFMPIIQSNMRDGASRATTSSTARMIAGSTNFSALNSAFVGGPVGVGRHGFQEGNVLSPIQIFNVASGGTDSRYREARYTFGVANPNTASQIGGILFNGTGHTSKGLFWKFDNNPIKEPTKTLAVTLRQTVTRSPIPA
jgi:hypothetical protein